MQKTSIFILSIFISVLLFSCTGDYEEVSEQEFINNILPEVDINNVTIKNNELILISTNDNERYRIKGNPPNSLNILINKIQSENQNFGVTYTDEPNYFGSIFLLIPILMPFIILVHIILLWVALRRIIQSTVAPMEKLVYTIISIFVPLFGPIIYLTTKKN
ncbi:hypothetical protein KCTC52924_01001 [Arenibacter antarcticus]|uniref:PLD nuclease N-terminal domain-containing protein n=1 Tax=Arenibacter antarcticus TaxID=2040469 RepID=A0ABW5VEL2_9FLAO|nr:PLD nuclease N-terminal domain-containing protein [Arenibacter sp. H213]MCM4167500.1 hypothetical protein [Arenibacter sp. H213]